MVLGARVLEVHFTDRKTGRDFRDHELSFEPQDLTDLIEAVARVESCLGSYDKAPQACELGNKLAVRKGVVAARDLEAGAAMARDDLMFARPATEFTADQIDTLVGRSLKQGIGRGELIARDNLA